MSLEVGREEVGRRDNTNNNVDNETYFLIKAIQELTRQIKRLGDKR